MKVSFEKNLHQCQAHRENIHSLLISLILFSLLALTSAVQAGTRRAVPRFKTVHVTVALCDNAHQGIVRVPESLGNGQDPKNNLYWGALYGVKTFLSKAGGWQKVRGEEVPAARPKAILERVAFLHTETQTYLVADAYDGKHMKQALEGFLYPEKLALQVGPVLLSLGGDASLRAFVGHNGLMDLELLLRAPAKRKQVVPAIVLACKSRSFFAPHFKGAGLWGLVTTTGLMAPEAYSLERAVLAWARGRPANEVRLAAAEAYAEYQRIRQSAAQRLFATDPSAAVTTATPAVPAARRTVQSIPCPRGYQRVGAKADSFPAWVRALPLKPAGTSAKTHDGRVAQEGSLLVGVVDWPAPTRVQQCADVAIRAHAEFLYHRGLPARIRYRSLSGQEIAYQKWLSGFYQVNRQGSRIIYTPRTRARKDTASEFQAYLRYVMIYANSASLARDLKTVKMTEVVPGDLYIQPDVSGRGGIGHVSMIMDVCQNGRGERLVLFGYGYIPAQDVALPLPPGRAGDHSWFTLKEMQAHVSHFGSGAFHRFE